jgi:putative ABC transport system substrate-binding protein
MKMQLRVLAIIAVVLGAVLLVSYDKRPANQSPRRRVAILKLGSHALIDEVEENVRRGLIDKYAGGVEIAVYNANFEPDLLRHSVDQIVVGNYDLAIPITTAATAALVNAAKPDLNIVFAFVSTPQAIWGTTNATPRNVTGTSDQIDYEKNLQLIRTLFPKATNIGYLVNQAEPNAQTGFKSVKDLASKYGFNIVSGSVGSPNDVTEAAKAISSKVDAFLVGGDNTVVSGLGGLLSVADRSHLPVLAVEKTSVEKGCVAAYGVDYAELGRKTFSIASQVLDGAKAADIPILYFRETKLFINKSSLSAFGISVPTNADRVY